MTCTVDNLTFVRALAADAAATWGASPAVLNRLLATVAEPATNTARAGSGTGYLRIWTAPDAHRITVEDHGRRLKSDVVLAPPDPTVIGGRRLRFCQMLSDRLTLVSRITGTKTFALFDLCAP